MSRGHSQFGAGVVACVTSAIDTSAETTLVISGLTATGSELIRLEHYLV